MKKIIALFVVLLFFPIIFLSCSKRIYKVAYPTLSDGKYDSEFPYKNCSEQLQKISEAVKMLNCVAYYKSYIISEEAELTRTHISNEAIKNNKIEEHYFNKSASGTASIIYYDKARIGLLTCAHIIDMPDTIFSYFEGEGKVDYIQSISVKKRQINFVTDIPEGGELDIIAIDTQKDIAVLGKEFRDKSMRLIPILDYPLGNSKELEWGSFVYIIGFPIGYKMITRGIVSNPNRDAYGSFLIDALFNRGFSGGIVLAIRDGVPNFEIVGMAKSVSAEYNYVLIPEHETSEAFYDPHIPYKDDTYVKLRRDINYGITYSISIETIKNFFGNNKDKFEAEGYFFDKFID